MSNRNELIIAIDGYSSCGKSTLAKALAKHLGYVFIDSGAMYRGIALHCLQNNLLENGKVNVELLEEHLADIHLEFRKNDSDSQDLYLNGVNSESKIRSTEVAGIVSLVAAIPAVRKKLVDEQRKMGKNGGIVMDGRDIGSVVFPDAEVKIFVTADPDVRARRRFDELISKGMRVNLDEVKKNLIQRDHLDSTRQDSPLIKTADAILLDNTNLTREEQLEFALKCVRQKRLK
jgi:CMP/dCMP kinase